MTMLMMLQNSSKPIKNSPTPSNEKHTLFCKHCKIKLNATGSQYPEFCCKGCEAAWSLVHNLKLEHYYKLSESNLKKPAQEHNLDYSIFDSEEFQEEFASASNKAQPSLKTARILIDNITCYACIWLIRQALKKNFQSEQENHQVTIDINQSTGAASLHWNPSHIKLSSIIQFLETLGYRALPHRGPQVETDQTALIKVGVGLFVMMNVLSFALAEYFAGESGLETNILALLRWLSLLLTSFTLFFTGKDFFINTYRSIKTQRPHIDAPILIGLLGAFLYSTLNTATLNGPVYFDSITAIIALVASGRFVQQNIIKRNQSKMASLLNPREGWALTKNSNAADSCWILTPIHKIKAGDQVRILPGELMPLRTVCTTTCADISYEQLRGEAHWHKVKSGEIIPAGAVNGSQPIDLIADQNGSESYLTNLSKSIQEALEQKGTYQEWGDKAAWWLFIFVFSSAICVMIVIGRDKLDEAVSRSIAIFLVACPCTFAIGSPLAFGTAMAQALRKGILFKSQRALEKLSEIQHFIFDKTGTLTNGTLEILDWHWDPNITDTCKTKIYSDLRTIKNASNHQISLAISKYAEAQSPHQIFSDFAATELTGKGIKLEILQDTYLIGNQEFLELHSIALPKSSTDSETFKTNPPQNASTFIALNGKIVSYLSFDDTIKADSHALLDELIKKKCSFELLSGDSTNRTESFAKSLLKKPTHIEGNASPTSKIMRIQSHKDIQPVAMIGNGLNDSGAMAHSSVSISAYNASSTAQNASDICLLQNEMTLVNDAHEISKYTIRKIKTIFAVSVGYNLLGLALAASGHITPVAAAILMPISSITITLIATSWNSRLLNRYNPNPSKPGSTENGSTILTHTH